MADLRRVEASASRFTHRVVRDGHVCSEHTNRALAEKARARLVAMSNGKLTLDAYQIEEDSPYIPYTGDPSVLAHILRARLDAAGTTAPSLERQEAAERAFNVATGRMYDSYSAEDGRHLADAYRMIGVAP